MLFALSATGQTTLLLETFETDGNGSRYTTSITEFTDTGNDYFIRTDGADISGGVNYTNPQGSFFFGAQDIDGEGAMLPVSLTISNIDISGYSNLIFSGFFAEDDDGSNEDWDEGDYVRIFYAIDGGAEQNLLWFENDGSTFNSAPSIDTDFDGTGDGTLLTDVFQEFTAAMGGTGSSLTIRIEFNLNSGDEDIAIDNLQVTGETGAPTPQPGDIVITEIMQNPSAVSDSNGEYFEVYNTTGSDIDLNGWQIEDNDFDFHTIASSVIVPAGGYAVLGRNGNTATNGGLAVDYVYGSDISLANGADEAVLVASNGTEIDRVEYDGGTNFPDPNGASMNLNPMALDFMSNDDGSNWCTSTSSYGDGDLGTPGAANDMCNNNCVISGVVLTNDGECSTDDATFRIDFTVANGSGNYAVVDADDGTVYGSFNPGNPDGSYFLIGTVEGPTTAGTIDVVVSDGTGCTSDPITVTIPDCPPMATCVNPGDLVITEIMQNPNTIFDSNGEYFEIYNASGAPVDLLNYVVRDNDFDAHTISSSVIVPAGGYVVLARNANPAVNGGIAAAYEYGDDIALGNGSDEVILECNGTTIDAVIYDGGGAFPDPNGASMNLDPNTLDAASNDNGDSWCESTSSYDANNLGTPGAPNDGCSGLPAPYQAVPLSCNGGFDATFDGGTGTFDLSTTCVRASPSSDRGTYVLRPACGNFVFDARLESLFPSNAYAGITLRESLDPGAKMFSIVQYPGNGRKNVEYRNVTNGNFFIFWNATWTVGMQYLRIQRLGNNIFGYASFTGTPGSYGLIFSGYIPMSNCVQVGMFVTAGLEGQVSTATFSEVSFSPFFFQEESNNTSNINADQATQALAQLSNGGQLGSFQVFPNPVTEDLNVSFEDATAEEATIRILSVDGRTVYENVHGIQGATVNIPLTPFNMTDGVYLLQVTTGKEVRTERFIKASR